MKVLIVDDNEHARTMIKSYLRDIAEEMLECDDGSEALDAFSNFHPDWTLMDWEMQNMDGLAATRKILSAFPRAKIAIVTGHDDEWLREAARDAGALEFIPKDNLKELSRVLLN